MSFFMDGVGLDKLYRFAANIARTGMKRDNVQSDLSGYTIKSDNFELSQNFEKRKQIINSDLEKLQEGVSILDAAKSGIVSIGDAVGKIGELAKKAQQADISGDELKNINSAIKENLNEIQKIADNTKFGEKKLLDGSSYNNIKIETQTNGIMNMSSQLKEISLEKLGLPKAEDLEIKTSDDAKTIEARAEQALEEIKARQNKIVQEKVNAAKSINNLSQTSSLLSQVEPERDGSVVQDLNQSVMSGMLINPEEVLRSQITRMDENMILALLFIHS